MLPRGLRNNNPMNVRQTAIRWLGEELPDRKDDDLDFEEYESPLFGIRTGARILLTNWRAGRRTLAALIARYAPASENDTAAYVRHLAQRLNRAGLNVAGDTPLVLTHRQTLIRLCAAIILHECGRNPFDDDYIGHAVDLALGPQSGGVSDLAGLGPRAISRPLLTGFIVPPPAFYLRLEPDWRVREPATLRLDAATWQLLDAVNRTVNRAPYRPDAPGDDRPEPVAWNRGGDCEDYALAKLRQLVAAGLPRDGFRFGDGLTEAGVRHAVLFALTDLGAYGLDNRADEIRPWTAMPYRWRAVEGIDGAWWQLFNLQGDES